MSGPGGVAGDQLRAFVERIEHVDEEIKALTEDKKDIYAEASKALMSRSCARSSGSERRTRRSEMKRSLCSTSTFKHWRPPRHQSRRRRDQSSQGGLGRPFFLRPARNIRSCLRSLDVSYSGAPTSGPNRPLVTYSWQASA